MDIKALFSQIQPKSRIQYIGSSTYVAESTLWVGFGQEVSDIFGNTAIIMGKIGEHPTKIIVSAPVLRDLLVFRMPWYFGSLYDINMEISRTVPERFAWLIEGYSISQDNYNIDKRVTLNCEIVMAELYPVDLFENVDYHYNVLKNLEMAFYLMRHDFESNGIILLNANFIDFNRTAFLTQDQNTQTPFVERYTGILVKASFSIDFNAFRHKCHASLPYRRISRS